MDILAIIKSTPYWVWAVTIYLIVFGLEATKDRAVSIYRLPLMPLIFILWSLYSKNGLQFDQFAWWLGFAILATAAGYYFANSITLNFDKLNHLVRLPGSLFTLALTMIFFVLKYGLGVIAALNLYPEHRLILQIIDLAASGAISGLFLGRFINIMNRYLNA